MVGQVSPEMEKAYPPSFVLVLAYINLHLLKGQHNAEILLLLLISLNQQFFFQIITLGWVPFWELLEHIFWL